MAMGILEGINMVKNVIRKQIDVHHQALYSRVSPL